MTPPPWSDSATTMSSMSAVRHAAALDGGTDRHLGQLEGVDPDERALAGPPDRGAGGGDDDCVGHVEFPSGSAQWPSLEACRCRVGPLGLALLGEGLRALGLVGVAPHRHQVAAPALQASVRPSSSARHSARLLRGHGGGRVPGDLLGERLGLVAELLGRVDDLADHAQLVGPLGRHALVATHQGHAHDRLERHLAQQADGLDGDTTWPTDTWGSKNWASRRRDHDVGVGHPVEGAAGAEAVDRGDDRLLARPGARR